MGFAEGTLTFKGFAVKEPLPLATIQEAVLEFLQGRDDAVVYGAQAVNAYVDEPRMTQNVDILSTRARELAGELCGYLRARFEISVCVRIIKDGLGFRLYQMRKPKNRNLVDVRLVERLPPSKRIARILVPGKCGSLRRSSPFNSGAENRRPVRIGATWRCSSWLSRN